MPYNYRLERYRAGGGTRYTCPYCGRTKCFTRYVDIQTGEYLDEKCGMCDHKNSCPVVHYSPRDFFRDHPEHDRQKAWVPSVVNGRASVLGGAGRALPLEPAAVAQTEFYDLHWAQEAVGRKSTFRTWFESLPFDSEFIQQTLADYYVGATRNDVITGHVNYGPAAVFWMIDEQQRVHDAKLIAYRTDGHRVPGWGNWMRSICEKTSTGPQMAQTEKVLFGLHLVARYPQKTICIVESEKSALVCALRYPEYLWLATGGCGNLQPAKLRALADRPVVVYPDSGEYQKWSELMKASGHKLYTVVNLLEDFEPNTDIADIILGEAKSK